MFGKQVTFEAVGGLGTLNPEEATTAANGEAQTTFTAEEEEGRESIHAHYIACEDWNDENEMIAAVNVDITSESSGTLELHFTNEFPSFDASTEVSVDINEDGSVTFGTGTLNYAGEETLGEFRIRRSGTLTLAPTGTTFDTGDDLRIDVKENTTVNEHLQTWVWDGSSWMSVLDENITDTWNGGLVFYRSEAEAGGSTVQASTGDGSATWTMRLDPDQ